MKGPLRVLFHRDPLPCDRPPPAFAHTMARLTKRAADYAAWYNDLVQRADLAEHASVRGCMVIKPYGYSIWERMQSILDGMFKETGHLNAYFPLFIPISHLNKEATHVTGFAKECALVTHYRLRGTQDGKGVDVDPSSALQEPLVVRPTSETAIWSTYKNWIRSYRDLPLLVNQWSNVVRWEMRTRLFLRTSEFLWQEGHTAHATKEEAMEESLRMLSVYAAFLEEVMAIPVVRGIKTPTERFAGAEDTYCVEAMMQDGKALQAGTSHFLGQNFSKAFGVKYTTAAGQEDYVWGTSWGVSTRLMGALIMVHGDDDGLILPPKLAPIQVVIIPIYYGAEEKKQVLERARLLTALLRRAGLSVQCDERDTQKPGWKFAEYELKGVPIRLSVGPRDVADGTAELVRRDTKEKKTISLADEKGTVLSLQEQLDDLQKNLYKRAHAFRTAHTCRVDDYEAFREKIKQGQFVYAHWDSTPETEQRIKEETKATIRCLPLDGEEEQGVCIRSGKPSLRRVLFARAY